MPTLSVGYILNRSRMSVRCIVTQGYLTMPNGYISMAARDHRPYLRTGKKDPVDQTVAEGYQVMKRQANEARTHVSSR